MTHVMPGGAGAAAPSVMISAAIAQAAPRPPSDDRLADRIAVYRECFHALEAELVAACEDAAAQGRAGNVQMDDRATWDRHTWDRYLAAATRLEPRFMPTMRRLLDDIDRLERLRSLPGFARAAAA